MSYSKALQVLGISEAMMEEERAQILRSLGVGGASARPNAGGPETIVQRNTSVASYGAFLGTQSGEIGQGSTASHPRTNRASSCSPIEVNNIIITAVQINFRPSHNNADAQRLILSSYHLSPITYFDDDAINVVGVIQLTDGKLYLMSDGVLQKKKVFSHHYY